MGLGAVPAPDPVRAVAANLALINLLLLAFNLIPAIPLDGGRILRAVLWSVWNRPVAATRAVTAAGRSFGLLFVGFGVLALFGAGGAGGGAQLVFAVLFVLIGFHLRGQAAEITRHLWIADTLGRRRVYALGFILQGIGMLLFVQLEPGRLWLIPFYYAAFGLGHAAWLVVQMTLIGDYFGTLRFATLRGLASMFQTPVTMIAPVLAGFIFDRTGTYDVIFSVYAGIAACGAIFVLLVRRPMWREYEAARAAAAAPAPVAPAPAAAMPMRAPAAPLAPSMDGAPAAAAGSAQARLTHTGMADSGP